MVADSVEEVKEEFRYLLFNPLYNILFIIPVGPRLDLGLVPISRLPELNSLPINIVRVLYAPFILSISVSKSLLYTW